MEKDNNKIKTGKKLETGNKSTVKINPTKESLKEQIRKSLEEDREMRRLAAQERAAEKEKESARPGVKSHTAGLHAKSIAKNYAEREAKSISWHDKKTKGKYIPGVVSNEEFVNEGDYWHPDPEQDRKLSDRGAKLRAREDAAKPKENSKELKPGESYMDYAKRHGYKSPAPKEGLGDRLKRRLGLKNSFEPEGEVLESAVPGKPAERLGAVTAIPADEREAAKQRTLAKAAALRKKREEQKEEFEIEEGKQTFPYKKVAAKIKDKLSRSVYAKTDNSPVPNTTDAEKKATTQMSKMARVYNKTKRADQDAAKARRSSTFYRDTHPASPPKMKKANEEALSFSDFITELNRYEKETGKDYKTGKEVKKGGTMGGNDTNSKVMRHMHKVVGAGRMGAGGAIQKRGEKKEKGAPTPGPSVTPAQKVAKRRASAKAAQDFMNDTRGT
jgi:hypothetical protein